MELRARLKEATKNVKDGTFNITFVSEFLPEWLQTYEGEISISPYKEKRSNAANAMFWACVGDIARATHSDTDSVYRHLLDEYGKYTYAIVNKKAVGAVTAMYKHFEFICESELNGKPAVQLKLYPGTHTYKSDEFSHLLDGTISEMADLGIAPPPSSEMRRVMEELNREAKHSA